MTENLCGWVAQSRKILFFTQCIMKGTSNINLRSTAAFMPTSPAGITSADQKDAEFDTLARSFTDGLNALILLIREMLLCGWFSLKKHWHGKNLARGKQSLREPLLKRNKQCQIGQKLVSGS